MAKLNDEQLKVAKAWLHDVFVAGGIYPEPKRPIGVSSYMFMYGDDWRNYNRDNIMRNAKVLCDAIKLRKVDSKNFIACDNALNYLATKYFISSIESQSQRQSIKKPANMLARYISWFCKQYEFYWDDSAATSYELDEIKTTILGKALWDDGCFVSQPLATNKKATQGTQKQVTTQGGNTQPKNPYKARGPLSNSALDLISAPNTKEHPAVSVMFCINGMDASGVVLEDTAYIRPVESDATAQAKFTVNNTNKALFGSAKGYGYCQVFFDDFNAAATYRDNLVAKNIKLSSKVNSLEVCKKKVLSNGYFKIGTEFGPVYISAEKLNEELTDNTKTNLLSAKERWDRFEEAFEHEL